jgi:hypothetical protein
VVGDVVYPTKGKGAEAPPMQMQSLAMPPLYPFASPVFNGMPMQQPGPMAFAPVGMA